MKDTFEESLEPHDPFSSPQEEHIEEATESGNDAVLQENEDNIFEEYRGRGQGQPWNISPNGGESSSPIEDSHDVSYTSPDELGDPLGEAELQEYKTLERDLESIDKLLDQFDERTDHLQQEILSLLTEIKSQRQ
jgi:hypothetical protein